MISRFFIDRPVFATVVSILIVLAGLVSMGQLAVERYPDLTPPTIVVEAQYPGASAETLSETVVAPLEQKINGVENMIYMSSVTSSNSGKATTSVFFEVGTDPDMAMINVNNRVQQANSALPEMVKKYGVTVLKRSPAILTVLSFYCDNGRYDSTYVGNYVLLNVVDELKRTKGVGDASIMAGNDYSIRVWLKPDKLAKLGLSASEIVAAISEQNTQRAAGAIGKQPMSIKVDRNYMITAKGRLSSVEEFRKIIIRANKNGTALRLEDVADVELGAQSYDVLAKSEKGYEVTPVMISLAPGANALATAKLVNQKLEQLSQSFPEGIRYSVSMDTTTFVEHSIQEVVKTLFEAILLVLVVILLFLKNWRATLIPSLAVPVSIIGAFAGMLLLDFSINTLTLFGLVLAIGIVVDDAIIVIENVERIQRTEKIGIREATIKAMDEVSGALVAIVLVLCAVFVPVSFLGGMAGTMYKQFAITIAVSVVLSGICALTLTPALCVVFLEGEHKSANAIKANRFVQMFDSFFDWLTARYVSVVSFFLRNIKVAVLLLAAMVTGIVLLFRITPTALVPEEDQGNFIVCTTMDPATTLPNVGKAMSYVTGEFKKNNAIVGFMYAAGYDMLSGTIASNSATMFVTLADWDKRSDDSQSVSALVRQANMIGATVPGGIIYAFSLPAIVGMDTTGGVTGYIQQTGNLNSKALEEKAGEFARVAAQRPEIASVRSTFSASIPQLYLDVDELKVMSFGVSLSEVYTVIGAMFNTYYVNDFSKSGRGFKVMIQAKDKYRAYTQNINEIYVKSNSGSMIPLSAFASLKTIVGPIVTERFNIFPAARVIGIPSPGYSSGQVIKAMEQVAREVLGDGYSLSWTGSAYQEKLNSGSAYVAIILGLLVVFLILAALYERWTLPIAVLLSVPFALFGAIGAIAMRSINNDIYFQVALITLVGLASKNAILIVEFAAMLRQEGASLIDAAMEAARLRFRPIVMTSLAFILGCIPLAISSGAGSASRQEIGTSVIGGMLSATILAPLFIPLFYVIVTRLSEGRKSKKAARRGYA